jgi:hypothetical protein
MVLAASVMGRNGSAWRVESLACGAALEKQQNAFFRHAVGKQSVIARDANQAENFFLKPGRSANVHDIEARFDYSGRDGTRSPQ